MSIKKIQTEAALAFLQTASRLSGQINARLEPLDLSLQQLKVLSIVSSEPDRRATVNQIREQMTDPASNVSRLLNKLVDKAWVIKERDSVDQRVVFISMTELGVETMCAGKKVMDEGFAPVARLKKAELQQLVELMRKFKLDE